MNSIIRAESVTKFFGKIHALDNVNLSIDSPTTFGVLGPNGAGKTTLIKIILGLTRPTAGQTYVNGILSSSAYSRRKIGYLPENHSLPDYHTPKSYLDVTLMFYGYSRADRKKATEEILTKLGMAKWIRTKFRKFSKGMKQRVAIASAIVHKPDIIFLDEPTDGVDPVGRKEIRDVIEEISRDGKTVIINSHLLSEVEKTCDSVMIINKGQIKREGSLAALLNKQDTFKIEYEGDINPLLQKLNGLAQSISASNGCIELSLPGNGSINNILSLMISSGIKIRSVNEFKGSLEDMFIQIVKEGE